MEYFGELMVNRQRLLWAVATRRQLERWEPMVAAEVLCGLDDRQPDSADIWSEEIERHLTLVAARNLLRALELEPTSGVIVDRTIRDELIEGRDLLEHWPENMPVFNMRPRAVEPPRPSGKRFAARNPREGPYDGGLVEQRRGAAAAERLGFGAARASRCRRERSPC